MATMDSELMSDGFKAAADVSVRTVPQQINALSFLLGPKMTEAIISMASNLDFSISHPYAARFDKWFQSTMGPQHPLSRGMPFMTPHVALTMGVCYLAFVFIGVAVVKRTGGVKIKPVMRVYNAFMVAVSFYMGAKSIALAWRSHPGTVFCVPLATGALGDEMARLTWLFTYSKVIEFLDTAFMIVEGRLRQVSFLHVYHHISILSYWFCITWIVPGADGYFSLAGNSFIHVAMYSYYLISSFGYSPWWKYYMTKAQIAQFCLFCVQSVYVGYVMTEMRCAFPNILSRALLWYMISLIALFAHFLVTNKGKKKKIIAANREEKKAQ